MGRRTIIIWTVVGVLGALLAVMVPVAAWLHRSAEIAEQSALLQQQIALLGEQGVRKQRNLAKWYNRNLTLPEPEPGFRDAYGDILNFGGGLMAWLEVPALKLSLPVRHGAGEAAHDPSSSFPIGGPGNRTRIRLEEIPGERIPQPGDTVYLTCLGERLCYRVTDASAAQDPQADLLTLVVGEYQILCVRDRELQIKQQIPGTGKRAALAAVLTVAAPLVLCIPGSVIRRTRKRFRSGIRTGGAEKIHGFREMNEKCREKRRKIRKTQL